MVHTKVTVAYTFIFTWFPPPEALERELKLMRFGRAVLRGIHSKHPKAPARPKNHPIVVASGCFLGETNSFRVLGTSILRSHYLGMLVGLGRVPWKFAQHHGFWQGDGTIQGRTSGMLLMSYTGPTLDWHQAFPLRPISVKPIPILTNSMPSRMHWSSRATMALNVTASQALMMEPRKWINMNENDTDLQAWITHDHPMPPCSAQLQGTLWLLIHLKAPFHQCLKDPETGDTWWPGDLVSPGQHGPAPL